MKLVDDTDTLYRYPKNIINDKGLFLQEATPTNPKLSPAPKIFT